MKIAKCLSKIAKGRGLATLLFRLIWLKVANVAEGCQHFFDVFVEGFLWAEGVRELGVEMRAQAGAETGGMGVSFSVEVLGVGPKL